MDNGEIKRDKKGDIKPDSSKRDYERVPLLMNIDEYYGREVKPYLPDSWMDRTKDKVGYEINFSKYFYKFIPIRSIEEITQGLKSLDEKIKELSLKLTDE